MQVQFWIFLDAAICDFLVLIFGRAVYKDENGVKREIIKEGSFTLPEPLFIKKGGGRGDFVVFYGIQLHAVQRPDGQLSSHIKEPDGFYPVAVPFAADRRL